VDPNSQLIKFILDGMTCECTLRTSGTEPKIKYYIEISSTTGETVSKEELTKKLRKVVETVVSEFLQPERWGLEPRPTQ
jgi:phosphomannomutase